jgi:hypothetical protein
MVSVPASVAATAWSAQRPLPRSRLPAAADDLAAQVRGPFLVLLGERAFPALVT